MVISINTGKELSTKEVEEIKEQVELENKLQADQSAIETLMHSCNESMTSLECFFKSDFFQIGNSGYCDDLYNTLNLAWDRSIDSGLSFIEMVDIFLDHDLYEFSYLDDYIREDAERMVSIYTSDLMAFLCDSENEEYINQAFDAGFEINCSSDLTTLASVAWTFKEEESLREQTEALLGDLQMYLKNWRRFLLTAIDEGDEPEALRLIKGEY